MANFNSRYFILELQNKVFVIADKLQNDYIVGFKSELSANVFLEKISGELVYECDIRRYINDILKNR